MNTTIILLIIIIIQLSYVILKIGFPKTTKKQKDALFVDTSALMDGRIVTAAQTGFIPKSIIIPRSVINELQLLADQADPEKRSRARRGLDAIEELKAMDYLAVSIIDDGQLKSGGVDERLIDLAKANGGSICTIDFNLNKAATAMGVRVLNINELAGGIRMAFLPGETISLTLTQKGQSATQAVGYLADGTMVVVDKAASKLNQTVEIEFIRSLQTAAGRMMFAKLRTSSNQTDQAPSEPKRPASARGRTKDVKQAPAIVSDKQTSSDAKPQQRAKGTRPNKRKSGEDSLLELVNRQ